MIMRMVVVLPAPLAPTKPVIRPGSTTNETSSTAVLSPNLLVRCRTSSAGGVWWLIPVPFLVRLPA